MTEIYIIRHVQAEGNLYRMIQGHWDGDVTALGLEQAELTAQRFKDVKLDRVYASDLRRACITAAPTAKTHGLEIIKCRELREINMGAWEGRFFGDLIAEEPEKVKLFMLGSPDWRTEGSETFVEVQKRAMAKLRELAEENDGKSIAVFSHGVTIRCILSAILNIALDDVGGVPICGNTAVSRILYENGEFTPDYINDLSHLESLALKPWGKLNTLRAKSFNPLADGEYYKSCYADAWMAAHGSLCGFAPTPYYKCAVNHYLDDNDAVLRMYDGEIPAGIVDMDALRGKKDGFGWLSLIYLAPEYRGKGYGAQLLGRAIMFCRRHGRRALRLHAAKENTQALKFYERFGFKVLSSETNGLGELLLLEKDLEGTDNV